MQPSPPMIPGDMACGQIDPELNKPKILDHPRRPVEKREPLVHPIPEIEKP